MTKTQLADQLASRHKLSKAKASDIVNSIFDPKDGMIAEALRTGDKSFSVVGFGSLEARKREPRAGRNPSTGESVTIPAHIAVAFKPGTTLKETVNS